MGVLFGGMSLSRLRENIAPLAPFVFPVTSLVFHVAANSIAPRGRKAHSVLQVILDGGTLPHFYFFSIVHIYFFYLFVHYTFGCSHSIHFLVTTFFMWSIWNGVIGEPDGFGKIKKKWMVALTNTVSPATAPSLPPPTDSILNASKELARLDRYATCSLMSNVLSSFMDICGLFDIDYERILRSSWTQVTEAATSTSASASVSAFPSTPPSSSAHRIWKVKNAIVTCVLRFPFAVAAETWKELMEEQKPQQTESNSQMGVYLRVFGFCCSLGCTYFLKDGSFRTNLQ